jgi:hypothetical protein
MASVSSSGSTICDEAEIESGIVLEGERSLYTIGLAANDNEGGHESKHFEIDTKLTGIPDLAMLGFQGGTTAGFSVDFGDKFTAN